MDIRKYFLVEKNTEKNKSIFNEEPKKKIIKTGKLEIISVKSNSLEKQPNSLEKQHLKGVEWKVFTDGSSTHNGQKNCFGGVGVYFSDGHPDNLSFKMDNRYGKVTNNICELMACLCAIKKIIANDNFNDMNDTILICTDSKYLIDCITKWMTGWRKNGWKRKGRDGKNKPIKNLELLKEINGNYIRYNIQFKHIKAHRNDPSVELEISKDSIHYKEWYGNFMADKLAGLGSKIS